MFFADLTAAFALGILTPLTAVCVIPLYPGFLTYLSNRVSKEASRTQVMMMGVLVTLGVIIFLSLIGLVFTYFLKESLTKVINVVSPIAFGILAVISVLLIADFDFSRIFPELDSPKAKNPYLEAFLFGFFFGAIVIPCNPLFIAALFGKSIITTGFLLNFLQFVAFGFGMGLPLLLLAAISATHSRKIIGFLTRHKAAINRITGAIMLLIALYYLIFVFGVFG